MFTVISYDVVNDKRRTQVLKLMKGYGTHVQYSVFECFLNDRLFTTLQAELLAIIDPHTDSVRCYRLDAIAVQRIQIVGIGRVSTDPTHYMI